jgi:hypothetical protein
MREICTSGSEGGGGESRSLPLSEDTATRMTTRCRRRASPANPRMENLHRSVTCSREGARLARISQRCTDVDGGAGVV